MGFQTRINIQFGSPQDCSKQNQFVDFGAGTDSGTTSAGFAVVAESVTAQV